MRARAFFIITTLSFLVACQNESASNESSLSKSRDAHLELRNPPTTEVDIFKQDLKKSYTAVDRPWVMSTPIEPFPVLNTTPVPDE